MNTPAAPTLYHVHDPMCSWCYAFAPTWKRIEAAIANEICVQYVVGGLAPDSDQPMPAELQQKLRNTWQRIQTVVPGTEFNFEFWTHCKPRRSTYPACRAVLAAKHFGSNYEPKMIERIQYAYYREARNPSDVSTLCELAGDIGLDVAAFEDWMRGKSCQSAFESDLKTTHALGVMGFPSLVLETDSGVTPVRHDYVEPGVTLSALNELLPGNLGL